MMIDLADFLDSLDDDISSWPEWRKRPEASPIILRPEDLLPV